MTISTPGPAVAALYPPYGPGPTTTEPLPRIGQVVRDQERLVAQAEAIGDRPVDPASLPVDEHQAGLVELHRELVGFHLMRVRQELAALARLALPPVGSAIPVRFPTNRPAPPLGEEPTPGSAPAVASAARESPVAVVAPRAGANFRPAAGPGFLPGPGEATTRIGGKHRRIHPAWELPPRWPLGAR